MGCRCMGCVGTRSASIRSRCVGCVSMRHSGVVSVGMRCSRVIAAGKAAVIGGITASAAIASAAALDEAMSAPAVAIAPAGPWAHAEEDSVVEVTWSVKPIGRAGVWRVVVVAILADGLNANADANDHLRLSRGRKGQAREQCSSSNNCFESTHR